MKKTYLKDLDIKQKIDIVINNNDLYYTVCEDFYEQEMENQLEEGNLMFGTDHYKWIDIRDYYSSFYLILKNWYQFIDNLDKDYLCQDGIDLYNQIIPLKEKFENAVYYSEEYEELDEKLESMCKELLAICEKQLHEYENYSVDDIKEYLNFEFEENNLFEDYYIIDDDKTKVYVDISYTKTFN